jgi:tRNA threonylcarbamoyladenosine biosynthesis protein TsaE
LSDLEATQALGAELAQRLPAEAILLLKGPLGAGKTSLVQGIALALGISEPITSPTFALAQHYTDGNPPLIHLDLYRLEQSNAADDLFLQEDEEAKAIGAFMAVEWPERLSLELPEAWQLQLSHNNDGGRCAQLTPPKNAST